MDVASWLIVNCTRCSLTAKASSGCVCVGRGEVGVAKSEMEKQMMPCQGDRAPRRFKPHFLKAHFPGADKRLLTALREQYTRHPKAARFKGRVWSFRL